MLKMNARSLFTTLIFLSLFCAGHCLCTKDKFQCDTMKCINFSLRCDGEMNCEDNSDELNCNMTETVRNATTVTMTTNNTMPHTTTNGNLTITTLSPLNNNNYKPTRPCSPKKCKEYKYKTMKNKRKPIHFNNDTKRRKKRPFHHKTDTALSSKEASTMVTTATDKITSGEVKTDSNVTGVPVTQCSLEECAKWKSCWRDVKRSRECACTEAACRRGLKGSVHAGKDSGRRIKHVFEWVIICILSCGIIVAIIVLLVKQRRLRQNKFNIHTVVCYHQGQTQSACLGRQGKTAAENRPLCDKARYPSQENVCYIDFTGKVKRSK